MTTPKYQRIICELCAADLGRHPEHLHVAIFASHCAASHPAAHTRIVEAYDAARRNLPSKGKHL